MWSTRPTAKKAGITVVNIRNYAFNTVPEHVMALMFALRRNLPAYIEDVRNGRWGKVDQFCFFDHPIRDVAGSTLGVIGYGAIGKAVAKRARALGMRILPYDVFPQDGLVDLDTIYRESDVITLHTPLTPETKNMIGAAELKKMKPTAILINTARGGLVDEEALAKALTDGVIGGAGFDVLTKEPPKEGNVLLDLRAAEFHSHPACRLGERRGHADPRRSAHRQYRGVRGREAAERRGIGPRERLQMTKMKKLLFLFDTDPYASVFDTVVAYDGGADRVAGYANVTPDNVGGLVDGTIFTRGGKEKQNTAIFVGGGDMAKGETLLKAVQKKFFGPFRVSVMLDPNGSNTTAAAGVALLAKTGKLKGKKAVVLAGTGPVGMRAAALLAQEGADVTITSRSKDRAEKAAKAIEERFGVKVKPVQGADEESRAKDLEGAQIVFAAGAIGIELVKKDHWEENPTIEMVADVNAQPPLGLEGIEATDKGKERHGKICFGALGIGGLKLKLHRACIGKLFESSDAVLDAENIYALAKEMA